MMCDDDGELPAMGPHQNYHNYQNYKYEHIMDFSSDNLFGALTRSSDRFDSEYFITSANGLPLPTSRDRGKHFIHVQFPTIPQKFISKSRMKEN